MPMRVALFLAALSLAACQSSTDPLGDASPVSPEAQTDAASGDVATDTTDYMPTGLIADPMMVQAEIVAEGTFAGASDHAASGRALLIRDGDGALIVRLEGFEVDNGPDLRVWAVRSLTDKEDGHIDLGELRSTRGDQNYDVPAGALSDASGVAGIAIWCRAFSVEFGTAPLG